MNISEQEFLEWEAEEAAIEAEIQEMKTRKMRVLHLLESIPFDDERWEVIEDFINNLE